MRIGYARVSTQDQNLSVQLSQLADCEEIYREKTSGATTKRVQLQKMLRSLRRGDVVVVTKLDRMARNLVDLLSIVKTIEGAGARLISLSEPWINTDTPSGRLVLGILGGVAEFERSLILSRCQEGREAAAQRGVRFGRRYTLTPDRERLALAELQAGGRAREVAKKFDVDVSTVYRLKRRASA